MARQIINLGLLPNDGTGDTLATIFTKINDNFAQLYTSDIFIDKKNQTKETLGNILTTNKNDSLRAILMRVNDNFDDLFAKLDKLPEDVKYRSTDRESINVGTAPNDGTGDSLRLVFNKINNNFLKLFAVSEQKFQVTTSSIIKPEVIFIDPQQNMLGNATANIAYATPDALYYGSATPEVIDVGALPNDGTGDPLRTAFIKINNNFAQLYSTGFFTATATTSGTNPNQVIFEVAANTFVQGTFQINSVNPLTQDSQNITLSAAVENNSTDVIFSGHSTLFYGNCITQYDMDVNSANVRVLCSPLVSASLTHTITYQLVQTV